HRVRACTSTALTGVGLGAGVAVVAADAVGLGHGALASRRVAGLGLVRARAAHRVGARASTGLTGVGLGTGVAVVAADAVGLGHGALASRRIAGLALVRAGAAHRVRACTSTALTGVGLRTRVAVVAADAVGLGHGALASRRIAGLALVRTSAAHRVRACASTALTGVGLGTRVAVVAADAVGLGHGALASRRVVGLALVRAGAGHRVGARAHPALAGVGLRTRVAVVAGHAVRLRWVRADSCRG